MQASWCAWTFSQMLLKASTMLRSVGNARSSSGPAPRLLCASSLSWWSTVSSWPPAGQMDNEDVQVLVPGDPCDSEPLGAGWFQVLLFLCRPGYIGEFEIIDDHRAGKIVVNLTGRLNKVNGFLFNWLYRSCCGSKLSSDYGRERGCVHISRRLDDVEALEQ